MAPEGVHAFGDDPDDLASPAVTGDDDLAPVGAEEAEASSASLLEQLEQDLSAEVRPQEVTLAVPGRPGYSVRFSTTIEPVEVDKLNKRARKAGDGFAMAVRFACILLGVKCLAVQLNGKDVTDPDREGKPLVLGSMFLRRLYGTADGPEAVRRFYGQDGDVQLTAERLLAASGVLGGEAGDEDPDDLDPTN